MKLDLCKNCGFLSINGSKHRCDPRRKRGSFYADRMSKCIQCAFNKHNRCIIDNAVLRKKTKIAEERCPKDYWLPVIANCPNCNKAVINAKDGVEKCYLCGHQIFEKADFEEAPKKKKNISYVDFQNLRTSVDDIRLKEGDISHIYLLADDSDIKKNISIKKNINKELVVSLYNENVNWLNHIPESIELITVYNKGVNSILNNIQDDRIVEKRLPNLGREAHTWLYHFITRRESLANTTFLAQGYPLEHSPDFLHLLDLEYNEPTPLTKLYKISWLYPPEKEDLEFINIDEIIQINKDITVSLGNINSSNNQNHNFKKSALNSWTKIFKSKLLQNFYFGYGAMYAVPKEYILDKSDDFYRYMINSYLSAYQAEALWYCIFNYRKLGLSLKFNERK